MKNQADMKGTEILNQLTVISGHLSSAILSINGEFYHQKITHNKYQLYEIKSFILSLVESATLSVNGAKLGRCDFIQVNSNKGILIVMRSEVDKIIISSLFKNESS
jgi:hypothetical protein